MAELVEFRTVEEAIEERLDELIELCDEPGFIESTNRARPILKQICLITGYRPALYEVDGLLEARLSVSDKTYYINRRINITFGDETEIEFYVYDAIKASIEQEATFPYYSTEILINLIKSLHHVEGPLLIPQAEEDSDGAIRIEWVSFMTGVSGSTGPAPYEA